MNDYFQKQILDLKMSEVKFLINKKVNLHLTRNDLEFQIYTGIIVKISSTTIIPVKPFEIYLKLKDGQTESFPIGGIERIEMEK
jgi:hypothetical protein